jgi:polyvinyl alcohol dehydrogenase (cytochrome)
LTGYPYIVAIRASDGGLLYATKASDHVAAMITGAPTIDKGFGYIGISSMEEVRAMSKDYPCCDARGSFLKFDLATGRILWRTYMTVEGFAGASVWGSMAPIDRARNQIIVATSNNHWRPKVVDECLQKLLPFTRENSPQQIACENLAGGERNWRESIVAMDMDTGNVNWAQRVGAPDAWNGGCFLGSTFPNCPNPEGPDYAFGQAPMLVTACRANQGCKQLAVVGQKSGIMWAIRVENGAIEWHTQVGPG